MTTFGRRRSREEGFILNEAVNLEIGVVFIAIPKTGTTSVRRQLKQRGEPIIPHPHLSVVQVRDTMHTLVLRSSLGGNRSFPNPDVPTDAAVRARSEEGRGGWPCASPRGRRPSRQSSDPGRVSAILATVPTRTWAVARQGVA